MKQEALKIELSEKELEGIVGGGRASDFWDGFKEPFSRANFGDFTTGWTSSWGNAGTRTAGVATIAGIIVAYEAIKRLAPLACKKGKELLGYSE